MTVPAIIAGHSDTRVSFYLSAVNKLMQTHYTVGIYVYIRFSSVEGPFDNI